VDMSHPTRSVRWVLMYGDIPHEYVYIMPGAKKNGTKSKEYLKINPNGTVPLLIVDDVDTNGTALPQLVIWDSGAILTYVAQRFELVDLYPIENERIKTDIDSWLHWHHLNSRWFTLGLAGYKLRPEFKASDETMEQNMKRVKGVAKYLDNILKERDFLAIDTTKASLADIIVYGDVGQCQEKWLDVFDFEPYPNLKKWLKRMEQVKGFEEAHMLLNTYCESTKDTTSKL